MSVTVKLECPPGTPTSLRKFPQGSEIRVHGKVIGMLGLGEPSERVRIEIVGVSSPFYTEVTSNLLGDYHAEFQLPYEDAQMTIKITAFPVLGVVDYAELPIAVGNANPAPVKQPGVVIPTILWVAGAGVALLVFAAFKSPSVRVELGKGYEFAKSEAKSGYQSLKARSHG
jgi:hypothetical protein